LAGLGIKDFSKKCEQNLLLQTEKPEKSEQIKGPWFFPPCHNLKQKAVFKKNTFHKFFVIFPFFSPAPSGALVFVFL
jgi:hypothetical protein